MRSGSSTTSTSGRRSSPSLPERVLTTRELNRALLARQLLLERSRPPLARALERVAGLQTQYAPSAYIGLWSRLESFELSQLTRALERKRAVQGTLMRSTIHVVSARDYWLFADGIGPSREAWWRKTHGKSVEGDVGAVREQLRAELAGRVWNRKELEALHRTFASTIWQGAWIELVRVPPSGTWERRRADLFQLAEEWIARADAGEEKGLEHLLRRYLGGFGPGTANEAANWAGVPVTKMKEAAERLSLRRFRDEEGEVLLDVPRAPLPGDVPAPVRFLPTWDATLLVHARRTEVLAERFRPRIFNTKAPFSFHTFLVDGTAAGVWRWDRAGARATLVVEPFEGLPRGAPREVRDEAARLVRFVEPDATSYAVKL
jgi:DNA glycosylase AlkZ-like